ncbi:MAG: hypothetical protein IJ343_13105 [Clostridia bacterium]|nr:hypothetical protein [Clostridia bacterium]
MAAHSYAQAYCSISNQSYRLTLDGSEVVAFTLVQDPNAQDQPLQKPLVPQPVYTTSPQLRACPRCGQRQVSSCKCIHTVLNCEAGIGYRFPCIYCDQLRIVSTSKR